MRFLAAERSHPTRLEDFFNLGGVHKKIGKSITLKIHSHAIYITIHNAPRRAVFILLKWLKKHVNEHSDTSNFELSIRQGETLRPFVDRQGLLRLEANQFLKIVRKKKHTQLVLSQDLVGGALHKNDQEFLYDF